MDEPIEIRTNVPKYTVVGQDTEGREIRLYESDGSIRNWRGQLLAQHPKAELITADNSQAYNKRRKQKILEAIESRITDVTKMNHPAEAIAAIVGKRAQIALTDETRTGNDAAKIVLSAVDAYQDKAVEQTMVTRNEYVMDTATRELLERILESRRENEVE